ncbi:MAG: hypothetical protein V3T60_07785, partial [Candidatus Binatia bacterium]
MSTLTGTGRPGSPVDTATGDKRTQWRELATFPRPGAEHALVLFTAHSLPEKILARQDPYPTR